MRPAQLGICALLAAGAIAACGSDESETEQGGREAASRQLASGQQVYARSCEQCHGERLQGGQGPNLVGADEPLANYETGQGLFEYVSKTMPFDNPGSLPAQDYYDVLAYLIDTNKRLPANTVLDEQTAAEVRLGGAR